MIHITSNNYYFVLHFNTNFGNSWNWPHDICKNLRKFKYIIYMHAADFICTFIHNYITVIVLFSHSILLFTIITIFSCFLRIFFTFSFLSRTEFYWTLFHSKRIICHYLIVFYHTQNSSRLFRPHHILSYISFLDLLSSFSLSNPFNNIKPIFTPQNSLLDTHIHHSK